MAPSYTAAHPGRYSARDEAWFSAENPQPRPCCNVCFLRRFQRRFLRRNKCLYFQNFLVRPGVEISNEQALRKTQPSGRPPFGRRVLGLCSLYFLVHLIMLCGVSKISLRAGRKMFFRDHQKRAFKISDAAVKILSGLLGMFFLAIMIYYWFFN